MIFAGETVDGLDNFRHRDSLLNSNPLGRLLRRSFRVCHRQNTIGYRCLYALRLRALRQWDRSRELAESALAHEVLRALLAFGDRGLGFASDCELIVVKLNRDIFLLEAWKLEGGDNSVVRTFMYVDPVAARVSI